ncbi:multidrug effflux MFS transporter [Pseudoxanthomonas daejeonensis]|nr:multidrug effflux MFS transporter [Pseudoxanthomonas daejeonensis]UNK58988.1 multidrug effflux MFS transporter [Pseudoxanthomonas daejeonensis]
MGRPMPSNRRLALLLGGLAMFGPFSIDTIFPAFPQMAAQFGADKLAMQQTISVYLAAYALMSIVHGPLSDAIGRRRVILAGLSVFIVASVGCALSRDLATLLAFRALQGLSAGVGLIVGRAVIRDVLHGSDAQRLMSHVSMVFGIAPAIAPIIGGWMLGAGRWPLIFWFLAAFSVLLLASTALWLPETHPPQSRMPLRPGRLARDYVAIAINPRFQRLAAAGAFGFAGLFLYIASAPAFVMDLLGLGEQQFAWLFIPTIGGMTLGAFVSGRVAGRWQPQYQVGVGYACMGAAALGNVLYTAFASGLALPWAVMPMSLAAFGVALVFPVLTLAILDMYPRQRGSASSLQAFTQLALNAAVAGVLSPLLSHHGLHLALGMAGFTLLGWLFWRWEARVSARFPPPPSSPTLEPGEQL